MGGLGDYKPVMAMIGLQFSYAGVAISTRAALLQGMSPRVFIVYRQAVATLVVTPIAYFSRGKSNECSLRMRSFCLIFLASLIGVAINQNAYFEGLYLASSSIASAMANLVPAVTFLLASIFGLEKVNIRSLRSIAKIFGTVFCVGGAVSMAMLKGSKLLNSEILAMKSVLGSGGENWLMGCLFLFASSCCWSLWLILQVPVSACYSDHITLSAWMCFMATLQSAIIALVLERDPIAWHLHSSLELGCCLFSGIIGSGLSFFIQAWVISRRGPLFSAMFNPLCTVIVTILAAIFLHEEIYTGSLLGAFAVISGLYVVLWGKANDHIDVEPKPNLEQQNDRKDIMEVLIEDSPKKTCSKNDLQEPLLADKIVGNWFPK